LISAWVINEQGSGSFLGEGVVEPDSDAAVEFDVVGLEAGCKELLQADKMTAQNNARHVDLNIQNTSALICCCSPVAALGERAGDATLFVS